MNRTDEAQLSSSFGPASDPVVMQDFLDSFFDHPSDEEDDSLPNNAQFHNKTSIAGWTEWTQTSDARKTSVEDECRVDDLRDIVDGTWGSVRKAAHIIRRNRAVLESIHSTASNNRRVRKKTIADPQHDHPDVAGLIGQWDNIQLKSWDLGVNSATLMRTPISADYNAIDVVKKSKPGADCPSDEQVCLITFSVHVRTARSRNYFTRTSQHVLLSSQSLGDLYEAILCTSNEIPAETLDQDGQLTGYTSFDPEQPTFSGCVICIENVVYGDGESEEDYADKFLDVLKNRNAGVSLETTKGPAMHDVQLNQLTLRINQPYWLLHAGNCEHTIVIDSIRIKHPHDAVNGYPLTTYIQPTMLDMCRGCSKVPAIWSIIGDIRLGESPCLLCGPCWRRMGLPRDDEADKVVPVPLPKYDLGW